jgi:hypothetical protein
MLSMVCIIVVYLYCNKIITDERNKVSGTCTKKSLQNLLKEAADFVLEDFILVFFVQYSLELFFVK